MQAAGAEHITWFHSFQFEDGATIKGLRDIEILKAEADAIFSPEISGKTVLDIGAWDGYFSFEAERRGAARVLATDHFCWSGEGWGTKAGFDFVHDRLGSHVETRDVDVGDLPKADLGQFDLVLFLGVFYHLKDPYAGLEAAASMCREHIVVETVTALPLETLPAMRLFPPGELDNDPTNFFAPNIPALEVMLRTFGFNRIEPIPSPASLKHPLRPSSSWRPSRPKANGVYRTIVHGWR
ncbi:MAG: DUF1698 domain-containing protein [Sphingomonadales bacterium]|nr:DUF1698 domain-containing protein [Sphingomonadales bacterium]